MRRVPLWMAALPLLFGVGGYWLYWKTEAESFGRDLVRFLPEHDVDLGGFPYRIEADVSAPRLARGRGGVSVMVSASRATINRQPWRSGHVVIAAANISIQAVIPEIAGARFDITAPAGLASVRSAAGILERLSMQFPMASVSLPMVQGNFDASDFQLHVRETPATARAVGPTYLSQADIRMSGTLSRPGGTVFGIEVPMRVTASAPLASVAGWRSGGTVEIEGARLLAPDGSPVAGINATLAVLPDGSITVSGTIETDCPATVRGLSEGRATGSEFRKRRAQQLAFNASGHGITLGAADGPSGGPDRNQEPPCPVLRR